MRIEEQARMPVHIPQMLWQEWVRSLQITLPGYLQRMARQLNLLSDGRFDAVNLSGTTAPTTGTWAQGDVLRNSNPTEVTSSAGDNYVLYGWICVAGGTPGTWEELRIPTGTTTVGWDDLRFPTQTINLTGSSAPPAVDTTAADYPGSLKFSDTSDNSVIITCQMPHRWKKATAIRPHIHWCKPTASANTVAWRLTYRIIGNPGETPGAWSSPITGTNVAGDHTAANNHVITSFGDVAMTDKEESVIVMFNLTRDVSEDSYADYARLYEFDLHYESDKPFGTTSEIPT